MALNWNIENIKDNKSVCWMEDGKMNPVTNALIWSTISVGLGSITDGVGLLVFLVGLK